MVSGDFLCPIFVFIHRKFNIDFKGWENERIKINYLKERDWHGRMDLERVTIAIFDCEIL